MRSSHLFKLVRVTLKDHIKGFKWARLPFDTKKFRIERKRKDISMPENNSFPHTQKKCSIIYL